MQYLGSVDAIFEHTLIVPEVDVSPVDGDTGTAFHHEYEIHGTVEGGVDGVEEEVDREEHPAEMPRYHVTTCAVWEVVQVPVTDYLGEVQWLLGGY